MCDLEHTACLNAYMELSLYRIHFEVEKLTVGDDELWLKGFAHILLQGFHARDMFGLEPDEEDAVCMRSRRTAVCCVFDKDSLDCGEHADSDGKNSMRQLTKIAPEAVLQSFWDNSLTGSVAS